MDNVFFDLDGTLINSQHRLYNLFIELCPDCKMSYEQYWKIKRQRITQKEFLKKYFEYSDEQYEKFHKIWLDEVEKEERLNQDFLYDGISKVLKNLSKSHKLFIVTNRQSKELTVKETHDLGINEYFCDILVTEQKKTKIELIKENVEYTSQDVMIGDTGEDIKTAQALNINPVAVSWGILDEKILAGYNPKKILRRVDEIEGYFI